MRRKLVATMIASLCVGVWAACGSDGSTFGDGDLDGGLDGTTASNPPPFSSSDAPSSGENPDGSLGTCDAGCATGARCKYETCVPDLGTCTNNDSCPGDSYCDTDHTCVPYGVPPSKINDPTCGRALNPGTVQPTVQCEWGGPNDAGDLTNDYVNVYTAPMVADLNLDLDKDKLRPSVVMTTWTDIGERIGVLRVFDGRTCTEQMRIGGPDDPDVENNRPGYGTQIAIGDLDNDVGTPEGHPEIVILHRTTGNIGTNPALSVVAFKIEVLAGVPRLVRKWTGRTCGATPADDVEAKFGSNTNNFGPSIHDIDNDGFPEVIVDKNVFDHNGCLLNPSVQFDPYLDHGQMSVVADVDLDGMPDLVRGDGVYGWNLITKDWELKPYFVRDTNVHKPGHVAVADLGKFSSIPGHPSNDPLPEIIVVSAETTAFNPSSSGTVRVQTLTGQIVFGPVPLFKFAQAFGGHGGPPTASDFDGDGQIEFAAAANEFYTVYDPDCENTGTDGGVNPLTEATRPGGKCTRPATMDQYADAGAFPNGVLWARPSQDFSSSETGSSIFDFNGDGKGEAVYRDECYLRVYEGASGNVIFSAPASSGTGQELPVIADINGNFATEIVVPRAKNNPGCPPIDPLAPPLAPDASAPVFSSQGGFVVLRDPDDKWVPSRPIWNQHAYSITNVNDDGSIPTPSQWKRNWEQPGMNNFRQNTQGTLGKLALADLTAQIENLSGLCAGQSGAIPLTTRVCNRGTNPVQDGVTIAFYAAPKGVTFDAGGATPICSSLTPKLLNVGDCTTVTCTGNVPAGLDVYVVTDPAGKVADCHPGNNNGASARVLCSVVK